MTASDNAALDRRFRNTVAFLLDSMPPPARILDLGTPNALSKVMTSAGYSVANTHGDLDENPELVRETVADATTAFEILEHLVSPMPLLRCIPTSRLFATVPLRLWFARAYRNPNDPWDRHYHEFEPWQFDWLLEKGGWQIIRSETWTSPSSRIGVRPLLRAVTPRYYAVEAVRS